MTIKSKTAFPARLRSLREQSGLSMRQLADKAGVTPQLISHLETSEANPRLSTIRALAEALGVEANALIP